MHFEFKQYLLADNIMHGVIALQCLHQRLISALLVCVNNCSQTLQLQQHCMLKNDVGSYADASVDAALSHFRDLYVVPC